MIMHKTSAHWEAGALPGPGLIARVGALIEELARSNRLLAAEGLGPSSKGVRLTASTGEVKVGAGPFERGQELPAGFTILRVGSRDEAVEWALRQAAVLGEAELDIRPVNEPWDIGMAPRPGGAPARFMVLRKATPATEAGLSPTPAQREALSRLIDETMRTGTHLVTENMRPSARGRRYKHSRNGASMVDGPFAESKELIGGYVVVSAASLDEAGALAVRYLETVGAEEVDVRELE